MSKNFNIILFFFERRRISQCSPDCLVVHNPLPQPSRITCVLHHAWFISLQKIYKISFDDLLFLVQAGLSNKITSSYKLGLRFLLHVCTWHLQKVLDSQGVYSCQWHWLKKIRKHKGLMPLSQKCPEFYSGTVKESPLINELTSCKTSTWPLLFSSISFSSGLFLKIMIVVGSKRNQECWNQYLIMWLQDKMSFKSET